MPIKHVVEEGEGITFIAAEYGFLPDTIWNMPENADLRQQRKQPEQLQPGDVVFVPDVRRLKDHPVPPGEAAKLVRKGIAPQLNMKLLDDKGEPRANEPYTMQVGTSLISGTTDAEGWVRQTVTPSMKSATLFLKNGAEVVKLKPNHLPPVQSIKGVQSRLSNMGHLPDPVDGVMTPATMAAVKKFQQEAGLPDTGKLDPATIKKLEELHGS